ncbi:MAG: GNAT family protein [Actinomycetaceae bacterium]|nr:GNAT family protein [Actinomycetaceae bacterium]MDU0970255.1 GNAT family protein [Actinomycetaceae bacterium]
MSLRTFVPADAHGLYAQMHGPADVAWKQLDAPYFHAVEKAVSFGQFAEGFSAWCGQDDRQAILVDGQVVGLVNRCEEAPEGGGWWELGVVIFDPSLWRRGIGCAALSQWIADTWRTTSANVLTLTTWSGNDGMIGLAQKVGFTECGRVPNARLWKGRRWDSVTFALARKGA